ncbi:MAG: helix-turn-helix domain-containing protein [Candidatus Woesearchaeota archaeon]|jgi:sugar-specific transcriptional regulator TrmB
MDTTVFEELGLTRTEIKIYLTLLKLGASSAGIILDKSQLPSSTVHRDLNSLIAKGLINFILAGKRKVYRATEPEHLFDFVEDKKRKLQEILPELKETQRGTTNEESASVYKGVRGIKEVYNIMINAKGKEYNTFGGGPITSKIMGFTWWLNLHKRRVANKLQSRQVFDDSVRVGGMKIAENFLTKIRYLNKEFAQFQETVIVGDLVTIAVFSENPYALLIKDKNVADSYRKYFGILWKQAKE